jgi:hypothetical protein
VRTPAARDGEPFDPKTGLPTSELRALRQRTTWYAVAREYMDARWERIPGNTRRTPAEALATITVAFVDKGALYHDSRVLHRSVYSWAFNKKAWAREPRSTRSSLMRLLEAVRQLPGRGPHLYAFFGCTISKEASSPRERTGRTTELSMKRTR